MTIKDADLPPLPEPDSYSATRMLANGELAPRFTASQFRQAQREAMERGWAMALEEALRIVATHQVSVGNSAAGEMACEMTMQNIREIHGEIADLKTAPAQPEKKEGAA